MVSKAKILADITNTVKNTNKDKKEYKWQEKKQIHSTKSKNDKEHKQTKIFEELQNNSSELELKPKPKSLSKPKKQKQTEPKKSAVLKRKKVSECLESSNIHHSNTSESDYKLEISTPPSLKAVSKAKKRDVKAKAKKTLFSTNKTVQRQFNRMSKAKDLLITENHPSQSPNISDSDYHILIEENNPQSKNRVEYKQGLKKIKRIQTDNKKPKIEPKSIEKNNKCNKIQVQTDSDDNNKKTKWVKRSKSNDTTETENSSEEIEDSSPTSTSESE